MKVLKLYKSESANSEEHFNINETFEIIDLGKIKSITPLSMNFNSVTTRYFEGKISHADYSDSDKWDIKEISTLDDSFNETTIKIDRHSGRISYYKHLKLSSESVTTSADGDCKKIDLTKKKF
jgi:hypothetical protein